MRQRRGPAILLVAALCLAALGSALVQESFVHTDDGCAVETHCLACRLAAASAPEAPVLPAALVPPERVAGLAETPSEDGAPELRARETQPRAPPAA